MTAFNVQINSKLCKFLEGVYEDENGSKLVKIKLYNDLKQNILWKYVYRERRN